MTKVRLRALTSSDIEKTVVWHNLEDISELYLGHPFPINIEMEKKWYEKVLTSNFPVTVLGIEHVEDKILIGITVLKDINLINRSAEYAIYIGEKEFRGKNFAHEATVQIIKFGFNKLGLKRIQVRVLEDNISAIKLYNKAGFEQEGILRKSVFKDGNFKNEILFSILDSK